MHPMALNSMLLRVGFAICVIFYVAEKFLMWSATCILPRCRATPSFKKFFYLCFARSFCYSQYVCEFHLSVPVRSLLKTCWMRFFTVTQCLSLHIMRNLHERSIPRGIKNRCHKKGAFCARHLKNASTWNKIALLHWFSTGHCKGSRAVRLQMRVT